MFRTFAMAGIGMALVAAAGALAFAAPGESPAAALTNCATTSEAVTANEQAVLDALNVYRQQNGKPALTLSPSLNRAASFMAEDLVAKGYWSHFEPSGRSPFQRAVDCGYPSSNVGENLAMASIGANVVELWKTSPAHDQNMLMAQWRVAGIGYFGGRWALVMGVVNDSGTQPSTQTASSSATNTPTATPTKTPTPTPGPKDPSTFPIRRALLQMIASE
jgi:uncharacterized protein YkwD